MSQGKYSLSGLVGFIVFVTILPHYSTIASFCTLVLSPFDASGNIATVLAFMIFCAAIGTAIGLTERVLR